MALIVNAAGAEIRLEPGEHVIGRGPLLKVKDQRVSRNHGILKVEQNRVQLCSKHKNPCFYKRASAKSFAVLKQDSWVELGKNDQFSLLPNDLIFTVKTEIQDTTTSLGTTLVTQSVNNDGSGETCNVESKTSSSQGYSATKSAVATTDMDQPSKVSNVSSETSIGSSGRKRNLPSWLSSSSGGIEAKPKAMDKDLSTASSTSKKRKSDTPEGDRSTAMPAKNADSKTVVATTKEPEESELSACLSRSTAKKMEKDLPACPYGAKCYRKNPVHFQEYSHDLGDADGGEDGNSGDDDRPECPYGMDCYRKNPLHRKQFKHTAPPASTPASRSKRPRRSTKSKKGKMSVLAGDSDDDGDPNTYDYNDSFIDDDELSESSASYNPDSDEDEDWAPLDESEDVTNLVSEAKAFMSNKKMHRT